MNQRVTIAMALACNMGSRMSRDRLLEARAQTRGRASSSTGLLTWIKAPRRHLPD